MVIQVERTGGFTGIPVIKTVNTDSLPPKKADRWRQIVKGCDFFHLTSENKPNAQRDRFQYKITIESESQSHIVVFGEEAMPESVQELVDLVMNLGG